MGGLVAAGGQKHEQSTRRGGTFVMMLRYFVDTAVVCVSYTRGSSIEIVFFILSSLVFDGSEGMNSLILVGPLVLVGSWVCLVDSIGSTISSVGR